MRTGIGYDIHRLVPTVERHSIALGGLAIPCFFQISAHSDGDVLLHAVVDAMLGSLALGDIGQWFPDDHADNRNRASSEFVEKVRRHLHEMGWRVAQVDSIVFAFTLTEVSSRLSSWAKFWRMGSIWGASLGS